jgi:hypothetical protein
MGTPAHDTRLTLKQVAPWLVLAVCWTIVVVGFSFNGLYGQDAHEYFRYTNRIYGWLTSGNEAGTYFWPVLYPLLAALGSFIMPTALSLQVVSLIGIGITLVYTYKLIRLIHPEGKPKNYLLVSLTACPFLLQSSVLAMSDALATGLVVGAVYHSYCFIKKQLLLHLLLATLLSGLAFQCRYACAALLLPVACYTLFSLLKHKPVWWLIPTFATLCFSLLPDVLIRSESSFPLQFETITSNWSVSHFFSATFHTKDGLLSYSKPNILYVLGLFYHPAYFLLFFPLLPFYKTLKPKSLLQQLLWITLAFYFVFLAGINGQNLRFLLPALPFVVVLFYPAWKKACSRFRTTQLPYVVGILLFLQLGLFAKVFHPIWELNHLEQQISETLKTHPASTIYTFEMNGALETYLPEKKHVSMWATPITSFQSGALVLFNPTKFGKQWENKQPMLNWAYLNDHYHLDTLHHFKHHWKLYEIE